MPDDTNPEILNVPENPAPRVVGLTVDEILRDPSGSQAKITEFLESLRSQLSEAESSRKAFDVAIVELKIKTEEVSSVASNAIAAKTQISDAQAVIATKSDHIQQAQEHADKVRADLDRALTAATQQVTETEAQQTSAEATAKKAEELLEQIQEMVAAVATDRAEISKSRKVSDDSATTSAALADKAESVEARVLAYEKRLFDFDTQCAKQLETIVRLLPGATGAGLAHAFDARRLTFLKPQGRWQLVFVISVGTVVLLAITGLWHVYFSKTVPTYDELGRLWLARLPVAGALVWLALHASHEAALAKRLEEDYGYKSAIASCFEGFQKQMSELEEHVKDNSPLATLCENTLKIIASPPGRIYDSHKLTVSPTDEVKDVAKAAVEVSGLSKPPGKSG